MGDPYDEWMSDVVRSTPAGLLCAAGGFHVDPWGASPLAVVTHVHGDHLVPGSERYLCAAPSLPILRKRLGPDARAQALEYGERLRLGDAVVSFHPAGHVLGSAQVRI